MENNKNKKSVKFQGDMLNFYDFIQVFVFTRNHHLNKKGIILSVISQTRLPMIKLSTYGTPKQTENQLSRSNEKCQKRAYLCKKLKN